MFQNLMLCSKDSVQLSQLLEQVSDVVEDGQQSSWQLFEDLQANTQLLSQLLDILVCSSSYFLPPLFVHFFHDTKITTLSFFTEKGQPFLGELHFIKGFLPGMSLSCSLLPNGTFYHF